MLLRINNVLYVLFLFFVGAFLFSWNAFASLSLRLDNSKGRIYAGALIDGRPMECLIDTGKARVEAFHPDFTKYPTEEELESLSLSSANKKHKYKKIKVKEIQLGSKSIKDVYVKILASSKKKYCVLGSDFLFKLDGFGFDFAKKLLTYDKDNLGKERKKIPLKVHKDFGFFLWNIKLNSFEETFHIVFDTGTKTTTFDTIILQKYSTAFFPNKSSFVDKEANAYDMKKFSINGFEFPLLTVVEKNFMEIRRFIPDFPVAFLGFSHFSGFNWFFDIKNKEAIIYTR